MVQALAPMAEAVIAALQVKCEKAYPGLLHDFPIVEYMALLDHYPPTASYSFISPQVRQYCQKVEKCYSIKALALLHQMLVATCISKCKKPPSGVKIPRSIWDIILREQKRILQEIRAGWSSDMEGLGDLFLKDLGFSNLRLIPNGAEVVEPTSGIQRRILVQGDFRQFLAIFIDFYIKRKHFSPIFQIHASEKSLHEFTPDGWDQCYLRIADLLEENPAIPGVFGTSWFFDPVLQSISPRLAYLRKPEQAGARFYHVGPDKHSAMLATLKSPTRRRLYEAGEYVPTRYLMIWFRDDLIQWANGYRNDDLMEKKACEN